MVLQFRLSQGNVLSVHVEILGLAVRCAAFVRSSYLPRSLSSNSSAWIFEAGEEACGHTLWAVDLHPRNNKA